MAVDRESSGEVIQPQSWLKKVMAEQKAHKDQEQLCGEHYLIKYDEGVMNDVFKLKRHDTRSKKNVVMPGTCCYHH